MRPIHKLAVVAAIVLAGCFVVLWLLGPSNDDASGEGASRSRFDRVHGTAVPETQRIRSRTDAWSRQDELPGPLDLHGTVVDDTNRPVVGAMVALTSQPPRTTTTDKDGAWSFTDLLPRPYRLEASKDDSFARLANVMPQPRPVAIVLRLSLGSEVRVRVVASRTQEPIAGARVDIHGAGSSAMVTDPAGWARFRGAPPVEALVIEASKSGWSSARKIVASGLVGHEQLVYEVELARAVSLSGRVVDQSGRAIAHAAVVATPADAPAPTDPMAGGVRTDDRGEFTLADVAPGNVVLRAFHPDFRSGPGTVVTAMPDAPVVSITVTLRRAVTVSGRVVDGHGQPAPWAEVHAYTDKQPMWNDAGGRHLVADGTGEFRIDGLPPTSVRLVASTADTSSSQPRRLDLSTNKDVADITLVVDLDGAITGVVVDAHHAPIAGASVTCRPVDAPRVAVRCPGFEVSDANGTFRLGGLGRGTYKLVAMRAGGSHPFADVVARVGDSGVQLVGPELGSITGHVRFSDGSIPGAARVVIKPGQSLELEVGSDGAFSVDRLDPGTYMLLAVGGFVTATQPGIALAAGQHLDLGAITVERGRSLDGLVVDDGNRPVADARVIAGSNLRDIDVGENLGVHLGASTTTTDDGGHFHLAAVPAEATMVVADHHRRGRSIPAPPSDAPMRLVLHATASLEGVVAGTDPGHRCFVSIESTGGVHYGAPCDDRGNYRIARITEGDYRVEVQGPARLAGAPRDVSVASGQALRLDF